MRGRSSIVVGVVAGDRVPDADREAWARVQEAEPSLASPFFRPEFTEIVAAVRDDVAVAVVRGDDDAIFFPFQRGRRGRGRPVGGRLSDYHGLVARGSPDLDAKTLLRACRLRGWDFDAVVAAQRTFEPFHRRVRSSPYVDLSRGFETFVRERAAAGSDQVVDVQRQAERLKAEVGTVRFEAHVDDTAGLEVLLRWKSDQYRRTGAVDIFTYPWVREVVSRIQATRNADFAGLLSMLYVSDQPVAAHLGMRSRSVWHYWLPSYERRFARYSPGLILLLKMAEAARELGLEAIDLGKGDALYKSRLANANATLAEGSVDVSSVGRITGSSRRLAGRIGQRTPVAGRLARREIRRQFR
jgi:CelD/BcsL family acetyltransferase involved in cellulose biosynthesis